MSGQGGRMNKTLRLLATTILGVAFFLVLGWSGQALAASQTIDGDLHVKGNLYIDSNWAKFGGDSVFRQTGVDPTLDFMRGDSQLKEMGDLYLFTDDYTHLGPSQFDIGKVLIQNVSEMQGKLRTAHGTLAAGNVEVDTIGANNGSSITVDATTDFNNGVTLGNATNDTITINGDTVFGSASINPTIDFTYADVIDGLYLGDLSDPSNPASRVTASVAEVNVLDGITASTAELNFTDGVTSNIQTQLGNKLNLTGGTISSDLTVSGTLVANTFNPVNMSPTGTFNVSGATLEGFPSTLTPAIIIEPSTSGRNVITPTANDAIGLTIRPKQDTGTANTLVLKNTADASVVTFSSAGNMVSSASINVSGASTFGNGDTDAIILDGPISMKLNDNNATALRAYEDAAGDNYILVDTTDATEAISFGNAVTNPDYAFLGSGATDFAGNVDANAGLDVTGALTVSTTGTVTGALYADGGLDRSTAAALAIGGTNANAINVSKSGVMTTVLGTLNVDEAVTFDTTLGVTGITTLTGNLDANGGVDVTGALTVSTTSTLTGNVDAQAGLDVTGGPFTFTGTAGSWTMAQAGSALTQTGTGLVTLTGNVDATSGLDVSGANFTYTGTAGSWTIAQATSALTQTGTGNVDFSGNVDANLGLDVSGANFTYTGVGSGSWTMAGDSALTQTGAGQVTFTGNVDAGAGVDVTGDLSVSGIADFNGSVDADVTTFAVNASGLLSLESSRDNNQAIYIGTTAGGIDITAGGNTAGDDLDLTATGAATEVRVHSASDQADAIELHASDVAGGITMTAGTGGVAIDQVGAAGGISLDAGAASNFTTSAGALTLNGNGGVNLVGNAAEIDATTTGALDLNSGTGTWNTTTTMDLAATTALTVSSGTTMDLDSITTMSLNTAAAQVINIGNDAVAQSVHLGNDAATEVDATAILVDINGGLGGVTIDGGAASNFTTSAGALTLNGNGGVNLVGNAAEIDATTTGALDLNSGAGTWDASTLSLDGTDATNLTMTANDGGAKTLTIGATNAGAGLGLISMTADGSISIQGADGISLNTVADQVINIGAGAFTQEAAGGQVTFTGNVNATSGLDVTGGALTIDAQAITQTTSGQVTFAGNVDAAAGLDVTGAIVASNHIGVTSGGLTVSAGGLQVSAGETNLSANLVVGTGISVSSGGISVTAGGLTVTAGGLSVSAGGAGITGDLTMTGNILPEAASTRNIGSATKEFGSLYLGDDTGINFGLDQNALLAYDETTDDRMELTGTGASLYIEDKLSLGYQDVTASTDPYTFIPTASYVVVTFSADNDLAIGSDTTTKEGDIVIIVNGAAQAGAIDGDTATMKIRGGADIPFPQYSTIMFIFDGANWIQVNAESTTNA